MRGRRTRCGEDEARSLAPAELAKGDRSFNARCERPGSSRPTAGNRANAAGVVVLGFALAAVLGGCGRSGPAETYRTYSNPIDIDYTYSVVNTSQGMSYRSGADPAVVPFRDKYFMFVTRSQGYWMSDDLREWEFIRPQNWFFESSNAPAAWPMGDSVLIAMGNPSAWQNVIFTDDPIAGTWRGAASLMPLVPVHDPALFVDDDGRVYLYRGSSNVHPIWGAEIDPNHYFLPPGDSGGNRELIRLNASEHGWERFGENHEDTLAAGYLEGAWLTKHNGIYYLQYAAPGTEWNVYADGVYTSTHPLGPFTYEEYSPVSYKPAGFIRGAGHGSMVRDPWGNAWRFVTMVQGIVFNFERRIGMFPSGFDADGQLYVNTAYGDYPHYLPSAEPRGREDWFTGWMLLSFEKPVAASSFQEGFGPPRAVDEEIKTYWLAETNASGEWLTVDLGEASEVRAIQVNYVDHESDVYGKPDGLYHQYLIESSDDGEDWTVMVDKRENLEDVPNDYVELGEPRLTRYVRFTSYHVPTPNLAISGLRVFGRGSGEPPAEVENFRATRDVDRRVAHLTWDAVPGAQGAHLYYGIRSDKLYNSVIVYKDAVYQLNGLNVAPDYFFSIEAFNENGISRRSGVIAAEMALP